MAQRRKQPNQRLVEVIQDLWQEASDREIAERTGFSQIHVQKVRLRMGLVRANPTLASPELRERIRHLVEDEGWPVTEVQVELGIDRKLVQRWSSPEARARNGKEYLSTIRWAMNRHPDLFEEIRPVTAKVLMIHGNSS